MSDPLRPEPPPRAVRFDVSLRTIGLVLLAMLAVWLFIQLWTVVLVVTFALVLVGTLNPLVRGMTKRGMKRGWAVLAVFLSLVAATLLLLLVTLPPLVGQLIGRLESAPEQRERLLDWLHQRPLTNPLATLVRDIGTGEQFASLGSMVLTYSSHAVVVLGYALTSIMLAFYILADGERSGAGLYAITPRRWHVRLARILIELEIIVGGYVRGQLITSAAIAVFTFGLLTVCGVENALPLAVFAGLTDVIPFVGGMLAILPAAAAGLGVSSTVALVILVSMIVYLEFESRILVPRIYGKVLRLSAATVILALLIGGTLLGILGAFLALPIAAGMGMVLRELRVEMPGDDTDSRELRARDARVEQTYAVLSAGAAPQEAAAIATDVARHSREVTQLEAAAQGQPIVKP